MAKQPRYTQDEPPPADWTPTQAVADPVINSPYDEPTQHWSYQDGQPFQVPGRRPAMYWYRSQEDRRRPGRDIRRRGTGRAPPW